MWNQEKLTELEQMLKGGATLQICGDHFGITRQGIRYVQRKYFPDIKLNEQRQQKRQSSTMLRKQARALERKQITLRNFGREEWYISDPLRRAQKNAFVRKRNNTKGWEFTITMDDLVWPSHCPVLGIELDWFSPRVAENSPSFDRIDSSKGYVPGNVRIMSWRANRIKNDGTAEEHEKIASWMRGLQPSGIMVQ
jgi:hypothetical protein